MTSELLQGSLILYYVVVGLIFLQEDVFLYKLQESASFMVSLTCVALGKTLKLTRSLTKADHHSIDRVIV
jgi:hypothetical protein